MYKYPLTMRWKGLDIEGYIDKLLVVEFHDLREGIIAISTLEGHEPGRCSTSWVPHNEEGFWEEYTTIEDPIEDFFERIK